MKRKTPYYDGLAYEYKLACDGLDLSRSPFGKEVLNSIAIDYVNKHCVIDEWDGSEEFIRNCVASRHITNIEYPIPSHLLDKYEIGYFQTSKNNCFNHDYILFNKHKLEEWTSGTLNGIKLWGLEFIVIPSRDANGKINDIGFRILNPERVANAFKWLFAYGQQATFGLHLCKSKEIILCEGAWDQIAFRESGYENVVGLGSVFITEGHKEQLRDYSPTVCFDQDTFGIAQRKESEYPYCFFTPEGKDPFEAWLKFGEVHPLFVEN